MVKDEASMMFHFLSNLMEHIFHLNFFFNVANFDEISGFRCTGVSYLVRLAMTLNNGKKINYFR